MEKVGCSRCGTLILPSTAQATGGLCRPCSAGIREDIEKSKARSQKRRERDDMDPERVLWTSLVRHVHGASDGFESLSEPEKKYFTAALLVGEVHNGGFEQFFSNHSGEYFVVVCEALRELGALDSLRLLQRAKDILFHDDTVPAHTPTRRQYLADHPVDDQQEEALDGLNREFWAGPDSLHEKLTSYAKRHGLLDASA